MSHLSQRFFGLSFPVGFRFSQFLTLFAVLAGLLFPLPMAQAQDVSQTGLPQAPAQTGQPETSGTEQKPENAQPPTAVIQGGVKQNEAQQAVLQASGNQSTASLKSDCPADHVKVYVLGAARKQQLICYPVAEGGSGEVFMSYVISKADGFETERAIVERLYLFDLDANEYNRDLKQAKKENPTLKKQKKAKLKRLFDMEEMEFQKFGFIRSKNQEISFENKHNGYALLVSKPSGSSWLDFISRTIGLVTTFGAFAGIVAAN